MDEQGRALSQDAAREPSGLRFGVFELDLRSGELRKGGLLVKLAPQPFQMLSLLARRRGELLTREEIRSRIWSDGTYVDFDQRLNSCVNQVRQALGDDADAPRYIETLPKRGYRWLAAVEELFPPAPARPALHVVVPFGGRAEAAAPPDAVVAAPQAGPPRGAPRAWAVLHSALTLAALAAAVYLWTAWPAANGAAAWRRVTFQRGTVGNARFGPSGEAVYRAAWDNGPREVYVAALLGPDARRIELPGIQKFLALSSRGELAYLRLDDGSPMLARVPIGGGAPRDVLKHVTLADWMPDGSDFAVVRGEDKGRHRLEFPIGTDMGEVEHASALRVSPDGRLVALLQHPTPGDDAGDVLVVDRSGNRRRISGRWASLGGLAWGPGSDEVWFGGARSGSLLGVQAARLDGRERTILQTGTRTLVLDLDARGRALLDAGTAHSGARFGAQGEAERELSWFDATSVVDISRDGRQVLLVESGDAGGRDYGIYLRSTDGGEPVRLGSGRAFALSPDGAWVLAIPVRDPARIEMVPTGAGSARLLRHAGLERYEAAVFAGDARHIVFSAHRTGSDATESYWQDLDSEAPPRALGAFGLEYAAVSPDGRKLVRPCASGSCALDLGTGEETPLALAPGEMPIFWGTSARQLFVRQRDVSPPRLLRVDLATGSRTPWLELRPADLVGINSFGRVLGTPDGRAFAYTYFRRLSELFVVEGLR